MPKYSKTDNLERYHKLPISFFREGLRAASKLCKVKSLDMNYTYSGKDYRYAIQIATTPCHYGGYRYWWQCPNCNKRVGVLYRAGLYICRHCMGFNYKSQHQRPNNKTIEMPKSMGGKTLEQLYKEFDELENYYMGCLSVLDGIPDFFRTINKWVHEVM